MKKNYLGKIENWKTSKQDQNGLLRKERVLRRRNTLGGMTVGGFLN